MPEPVALTCTIASIFIGIVNIIYQCDCKSERTNSSQGTELNLRTSQSLQSGPGPY